MTDAVAIPRVAVVLVNWHGARDTAACLLSLERMDSAGAELSVLVVDNASTDDSVAALTATLQTAGYQAQTGNPGLQADARIASLAWFAAVSPGATPCRVALVRNRANLGFAAGNNIGYRVAESAVAPQFVWLLNNDTEVRPDALRHLLGRMRAQPDLGMCGCTIVYFNDPQTIQCSGGVRYSHVTGRGSLIGAGRSLAQAPDNTEAEAGLVYINGASMFLRCSAIERIGLMAEEYFLFNEEVDWAWRARGHCRLGVETAAVVLHKEGATIGTATARQQASPLANFFQTRSKLMFARKFTPWFLPTVWLVLLLRFAKQFASGNRSTSLIILQVLLGRRWPDPKWFQRRAGSSSSSPGSDAGPAR